jgi:hypothetical protein
LAWQKKEQQMRTPLRIQEVIELVRFEFRRYGFRADGPGEIKAKESSIRCEFEAEPATGQAAFTQYKIVPHFRIWVGAETADAQGVLKTDEERISLDLSVSYEHVNGGSNGLDVRYELERPFLDSPRLIRRCTH